METPVNTASHRGRAKFISNAKGFKLGLVMWENLIEGLKKKKNISVSEMSVGRRRHYHAAVQSRQDVTLRFHLHSDPASTQQRPTCHAEFVKVLNMNWCKVKPSHNVWWYYH